MYVPIVYCCLAAHGIKKRLFLRQIVFLVKRDGSLGFASFGMVGPGTMPSQILLVTRAENRYYPPIGDGLPLDLQLYCQVYCLDGVFSFILC